MITTYFSVLARERFDPAPSHLTGERPISRRKFVMSVNENHHGVSITRLSPCFPTLAVAIVWRYGKGEARCKSYAVTGVIDPGLSDIILVQGDTWDIARRLFCFSTATHLILRVC